MKHPASADSANISEIFSSLQGEGTWLGVRQIFIRFEECHIHCTYCDEDKPGKSMRLDEVMDTVRRLEKSGGPHRSVSLTGGEPLLYVPFLKSLMPRLKEAGYKIYLETNGILWKPLQEVLEWCDVIAMDMKPASVTGEKHFYDEHQKFLETAKAKETFIKIVISNTLAVEEFDRLLEIAASTAPELPVILQPVSSGTIEGHEDRELMDLLIGLQKRGLERKLDVRITPRFHKILGIK